MNAQLSRINLNKHFSYPLIGLMGMVILVGACTPDNPQALEQKPLNIIKADPSHKVTPQMIGLTSDWCSACSKMEPVIRKIIKQCNNRGVDINLYNVGDDRYENFVAHHDIQALPTYLFFDEHGFEMTRLVGIQSETSIKKALSLVRGKTCPGLALSKNSLPSNPGEVNTGEAGNLGAEVYNLSAGNPKHTIDYSLIGG